MLRGALELKEHPPPPAPRLQWSCVDAKGLGYDTVMVEDATRGITPAGVQETKV